MKNIYLVGFMGSGKSTVGRLLSKRLNLKFVDVDLEIEKKEKKKISDIFREKGEQYFRKLEKREIEELTKKKGIIVSTGGGLGSNPENMKKMKETGIVIWLDVPLEEILKRCKNDKNRPLLNQPVDNLKKLYEKRKMVYSKADIRVNTLNKSVEEIVEHIENLLRSYGV